LRRSSLSNRSLKWIARYSLENGLCRENVTSMCETIFDIKLFSVGKHNGEDALYITYNTKSYIAYISKDNVCIELLESNINNNGYHKLDKFFAGDNCWYDLLCWISNRGNF
jgi:hypothetical protein